MVERYSIPGEIIGDVLRNRQKHFEPLLKVRSMIHVDDQDKTSSFIPIYLLEYLTILNTSHLIIDFFSRTANLASRT